MDIMGNFTISVHPTFLERQKTVYFLGILKVSILLIHIIIILTLQRELKMYFSKTEFLLKTQEIDLHSVLFSTKYNYFHCLRQTHRVSKTKMITLRHRIDYLGW